MPVYQVYPKKRKSVIDFSKFSMTTKLIVANVLFFVIFYILNSLNVLPLEYIALSPSGIFENFYIWTFFTSMFMHGGIFHLFVNMLSLFFVGGLIEKILGKKRYFWFYIFAGLFAGLLYIFSPFVFSRDWNTLAVGASGALFGLIGVLMFLTPNLPVYMMFIPIPVKMKYAAPAMIVLLWLISVTAGLPIGNIAHLGGLIFGVIYGIYLRRRFPNKVKSISRHFS
jgi:membrane associated rhomboid family serine protease